MKRIAWFIFATLTTMRGIVVRPVTKIVTCYVVDLDLKSSFEYFFNYFLVLLRNLSKYTSFGLFHLNYTLQPAFCAEHSKYVFSSIYFPKKNLLMQLSIYERDILTS